ncbi:extracellular solute-binding protein [Chitinibacter fontanus]|uniref:Extracellular solute-binding protein n=1 Tax=Chitinibacter fontanus TaxID=1737446 RepID=A0A7D5VBX1_9NEIS|nr:extracellular solute-binding protein [Chitinibacter fontanus]QLI82493.1 extracellular solute-binding protein [Chitinibacter fontanus]
MKIKPISFICASLFAGSSISATAAVQVEFWSHALGGTYDAYHQKIVNDFNASQKEIELVHKDLTWGGMKPAIVAAVAEGKVPGLVMVPAEWMNEMAPKLLTPVTKEIAPFKNQYTDAAIQNASKNGEIYGFPSYQVTAVMVYNKDMLAKAGVKPEFNTVDDVFIAAKKIKDKTGKPGWAPKLQDGFQTWFLFQGLPLVKDNKAVFNSPAHIALVQKFADAYKAGIIVKDTSLTFDKQIAGFANNSIGMFAEGGHAVIKIKDANPRAYAAAGVTSFPLNDAKTASFGGWSTMYVVPKGQKNMAAVAKAAQYITSDAVQLEFSKASNTYASTKKANATLANDPVMNDPNDLGKVAFKMGALTIDKSRHFMIRDVPDEAMMHKLMNDKIDAAIQGRIPVKQALDEAVAAWNKRLAKK